MRARRGAIRRAATVSVAMMVALAGQGLLGLGGTAHAAPSVMPELRTQTGSGQTAVRSNDTVEYGGTASAGARVVGSRLLLYRNDGSFYGTEFARVTTISLPTMVLLGGTKTGLSFGHASLDGGEIRLEVTVEDDSGERATQVSNALPIDITRPSIVGTFLTGLNEVEVRFSEDVRDPLGGGNPLDWALTDENGDRHYWNENTLVGASGKTAFADVSDGDDDTRTLTLDSGSPNDFTQDEDATPGIWYLPAEQQAGSPANVLKQYRDGANQLVSGDTWEDPAARDLVPPTRIPNVVSVAGTELAGLGEGDLLIGSDTTPGFEISNLRLDGPRGPHGARVYLETGLDPSGLQTSGPSADTLVGSAIAAPDGSPDGTGTATISTDDALPSGLEDGTHVFHAVAADRALCNPNPGGGSTECPNLTEAGATVEYILDTVGPIAAGAELKEADQLWVTFSEAILPADAGTDTGLGTWTVTSGGVPIAVESVVSAADQETLEENVVRVLQLASEPAELPVVVSWTPTPDAYTDIAGNDLGDFTLSALNDVPVILGITSPANGKLTNQAQVTIKGAVTKGLTPRDPDPDTRVFVDVFQDLDGDLTHDDGSVPAEGAAEPIQTIDALAATPSGTFQATFPLGPDGDYTFVAIGRREQPNSENPLTQVIVSDPVSRLVTRDQVPPQVSFLVPSIGELPYSGLADSGNDTIDVQWTATDNRSLQQNTAVLYFRTSPAEAWGVPKSTGLPAQNGSLTDPFPIPKIDTVDPTASFLVTVTDEADNITTLESPRFEIDSTRPAFTAVTLDTTSVRVKFTEEVLGEAPQQNEWRLNGALPQELTTEVADGEIQFVLEALPGKGWGPNGSPNVTYKPIDQVSTLYRDEAQNPVCLCDSLGEFPNLDEDPDLPLPRTTKAAEDGIAPSGFTLAAAPALVDAGAVTLTGQGDGTQGNQVIAKRISPTSAESSADVQANGAFAIGVPLAQDAINVFEVRLQDPASNAAPVLRRVTITEDSTAPILNVLDGKKKIKGGKKKVAVRWSSVEEHEGFAAIYMTFKKRGGKTRVITIAQQTADDGHEVVKFRKGLAKKMKKGKIGKLRFQVVAFDALGHASSDEGRWIRIRARR